MMMMMIFISRNKFSVTNSLSTAMARVLASFVLVLSYAYVAAGAGTGGWSEEARLYDRNLQHFSPEGRIYQVRIYVWCKMLLEGC